MLKRFSNINQKAFLIIEIFVFLLFAVLTEKALEYLLVTDDGFTEQLMEDFYQMDENIDNIYLGSSHVHYNIEPEILDAVSGENNFCLSTGLQPMNSAYYLLKEADKRNDLSHVYVELSCGLTIGDYGELKTYDQLPNNWRVLNYVKPSVNKLQWMLDISEPEYYYLTFMPSRRYYKELLDGSYIAGQIAAKLDNSETKWRGGYVYKGYRESFDVIDGMYAESEKQVTLAEKPLTEDVEEYLIKIIKYCQENEIEITLFTAPIIDCEIHNLQGYDNWGEQIRQLAGEYGINYYDFNLCKSEYLNLYDEKYWRDNNHLNKWGADVFSQFIAEVFEKEKKTQHEVDEYFYTDYQQKMNNETERIFGLMVSKDVDEPGNRIFTVSSIDNYKEIKDIEYCFSLSDENGEEQERLQEWSKNNVCIISPDEVGKILNIEVRKENSGEQEDGQYKLCRILCD